MLLVVIKGAVQNIIRTTPKIKPIELSCKIAFLFQHETNVHFKSYYVLVSYRKRWHSAAPYVHDETLVKVFIQTKIISRESIPPMHPPH